MLTGLVVSGGGGVAPLVVPETPGQAQTLPLVSIAYRLGGPPELLSPAEAMTG